MKLVFRTHARQAAPADAVLLDRFAGRAATVHSGGNLLEGLRPPAAAMDILNLGEAVYAADRVVGRPGDWEPRDLELIIPVSDPDRLRAAAPAVDRMLNFLTGDRWSVAPAERAVDALRPQVPTRRVDAVCLLSGGLDSLAGAIDLLAGGNTADLVSHYEPSTLAHDRQGQIAERLITEYGRHRVRHRSRALAPIAAERPEQARPLGAAPETTTRSRSLLFAANGLAVAATYGADVPLMMPENGFVGLNVPLTRSRLGPLSTRTTHPYLMKLMGEALDAMGATNPVVNPYRLATKGEMLSASLAPALLAELATVSLSCSHPEQGRYTGRVGNCGHCWPCLIRRAAMHAVGWDDPKKYLCDVLTDATVLNEDRESGAHLRALLVSLARATRPEDVLRNGPIAAHQVADFLGLYHRGRAELGAWLAGGQERITRRLTFSLSA